tara:strand:+ start:343 stop:1308 length:966 start_codon:yes stop_codon:yes gene_type:complete
VKTIILLFFIISHLFSQNSPLEYYSQGIIPTEIPWINDDLSGVTINTNSNSLFMIENDEGKIWELDTNFNHIRTILGGQFGDEEDIVYLNNDDYAIVTEEGDLYIGKLNLSDNDIDPSDFQKITFNQHNGNSGSEGVAYDSLSQTFYIVKEKDPMAFYTFNRPDHDNDTTISVQIPFDAENEFSGIMADLSSISFDYRTNRVLIVSDESQKVIDVEPSNGLILSQINLSGMDQAEGICFLNHNYDLLIVGEPNYYTVYTNINLFGDVNLDGQINYFDIVVIIDYIFGNIVIDDLQIFNSDIDYNHSINIFDILLILDFYNN